MTRPVERIDVNADLGEGCTGDDALLALVSTASIACGGHAGGGDHMAATIDRAHAKGVAVGAHPSYPDRDRFGRVSLAEAMDPMTLGEVLRKQLGEFAAAASGIALSHVKPHGALYHDAARIPWVARTIVHVTDELAARVGGPLSLLGPPSGHLRSMAGDIGITYIREGFADRAYRADGSLVPRTDEGAVHHDGQTVVAQAISLARGHVRCSEGVAIPLDVQSLCIHGDTPAAVEFGAAIREAFRLQGIDVLHWAQL